MNETNLLENVKVGDKVILNGRHNRRVQIATKVTRTQIQTAGGRYRKDGGQPIGDKWSFSRLVPWTQEAEDDIAEKDKHSKLAARIGLAAWTKLPTETLERVLEIIEATNKTTP